MSQWPLAVHKEMERQTFVWSNGLVLAALDFQALGPGLMLQKEFVLSIYFLLYLYHCNLYT